MTENKKNLIRQLMYLNGSINSQHEFIQNVIETIKGAVPEIEHISLADIAEDVLNEIIPLYDKYFTEEQLQELYDFFSIRAFYFKNVLQINQESFNIGEKIGEIVSQRINEYKQQQLKKEENGK
jgi:hypothetical protein